MHTYMNISATLKDGSTLAWSTTRSEMEEKRVHVSGRERTVGGDTPPRVDASTGTQNLNDCMRMKKRPCDYMKIKPPQSLGEPWQRATLVVGPGYGRTGWVRWFDRPNGHMYWFPDGGNVKAGLQLLFRNSVLIWPEDQHSPHGVLYSCNSITKVRITITSSQIC